MDTTSSMTDEQLAEFETELRKGFGLRAIRDDEPMWKANPWAHVNNGDVPVSLLSKDLQKMYESQFTTQEEA